MIALKGGIKTFHAKTRKDWRKWLDKNHNKEKSLWLIIYHKTSKTPSVYYPEAVEEALCFGWIDSKPNKRDHESYYLFFAQRKAKSNWSKVNRDRVAKLMEQNLITAPGQAMIDLAKKSGTWTAMESVDRIEIPPDLQKALTKNKKALQHFDAFPPSSKKIILEWIRSAKKSETRNQRIDQTVKLASSNIKANHYRQ